MEIRKASILITASLLTAGFISQAQTAFHRNSISIAITGGSTRAVYSTRDNTTEGLPDLKNREGMRGSIDPFIFEYGISNKFGVGFSSGGESYQIDANKFYDYRALDESKKVLSNTHYFTLDFNYHPYVTKRLDLSVFAGIGSLRVAAVDYPNYFPTQAGAPPVPCNFVANEYNAKGAILRTGVKARYYFWKRLGVMGMVTTFSGAANPRNSASNSFGSNYSTIVTGFATEFGLCFRFF